MTCPYEPRRRAIQHPYVLIYAVIDKCEYQEHAAISPLVGAAQPVGSLQDVRECNIMRRDVRKLAGPAITRR